MNILQASAAATPAMVVEAARESQYAALYVNVAAETLTEAVDDDMARVMLADALVQLERSRVESEYRRLIASGQRDEVERQRFRAVSQRLAELKGVVPAGARPDA